MESELGEFRVYEEGLVVRRSDGSRDMALRFRLTANPPPASHLHITESNTTRAERGLAYTFFLTALEVYAVFRSSRTAIGAAREFGKWPPPGGAEAGDFFLFPIKLAFPV